MLLFSILREVLFSSIDLLYIESLFELLHVMQVLLVLHLRRCHWERLFVKEGNNPLLAKHEFNHTLSFMLIQVTFFVSIVACARGHASRWNIAHSDTQTGLCGVNLRLGLLFVLLPFAFYFVNRCLQ